MTSFGVVAGDVVTDCKLGFVTRVSQMCVSQSRQGAKVTQAVVFTGWRLARATKPACGRNQPAVIAFTRIWVALVSINAAAEKAVWFIKIKHLPLLPIKYSWK